MAFTREVKEGTIKQGSREKVAYTITTTPWGSTPSSVTVKAYNVATGTEVTSTVLPTGSPSTNGDVITTPLLQALTAGSQYRIDVQFVVSGNTEECFFYVDCDI